MYFPRLYFRKICFYTQQGLLLLQQLTKSNAAIQKIVAFENAFERLLDIITEEGSSDGGKRSFGFQFHRYLLVFECRWLALCAGIVVEDCLLLLLNLLKNNSSNQNFFKEGSYIQRMKPWFEVGDDNSGWSAQKVTNLHLMLQVNKTVVICGPLRLNFSFNQHSIRCCSTELSAVLSAGASHGVSSEFPRSYSQLSEIHVSVWPAATALHHPHGHWCACWHPHRGKYSSTIVVVDCEGSHEAVKPNLTPGFRPSTLYQRLSGARKSTRTTLLLSTLPQIHHGRTHTHTNTEAPEILTFERSSDAKVFFLWFLPTCRPAIVVLLMSMVNERQPFVLRCAVLYCFQCFLYKNQKGQGEIVATLLPSTIDGSCAFEMELSTALLTRGSVEWMSHIL